MRRGNLAAAVAAIALLLATVAVGGALVVGLDASTAVSSYLVTNVAIGLSATPGGYLIARYRPSSPIGWLLLGLGIAPLLTAAMVPLIAAGNEAGWPQPALRLVVTIMSFSWAWGVFCCLPLALQLFPTGRPVSPRWRGLIWLTVIMSVIGGFSTGPTPEYGASSYLVSPWWKTGEQVAGVLAPLVVLLTVAGLIVRFVKADEVVRQQLLWLVVAVLLVIIVNVPSWFSLPTGGEIFLLLSFPLIPAAMTVAVLRHGLFDVRLVLSRLLLYGVLTAGVVGSYLALVAVLNQVLNSAGAPVLATLVVALVFNPVRLRLQRLVDQALYGVRRDPVQAVSVVGRQLAGDDLTGVLESLREALRLPYAAIERGEESVATSGNRPVEVAVFPLRHKADVVGCLVIGARRGERHLSKADQAVLDLLATPLAVALHSTALRDQLRESRDRLLTATIDERARLHRDLHDSLGPVLTGAAFTADGAALAARTNPERAGQLATQLGMQLREAITDVRRIVYALRPPVLDQLGLVAALRQQEHGLGDVALTVDAPQALPELPTAVEVAAYRIASEALTNIVRHSTARQAVVSLTADAGALKLTITDDGESVRAWPTGVGLESIRARATELGGACEAGPTAQGGRVAAVLPYRGAS
ncbi:histidine kinase [Kribbella voronezhensis]|uniref:Histidine kinase n=1 Tax=Kribbella voronezhensis TaxID=2512212 RepID=A0A4R7TCB6_9ACTN|nr:GAF domain-containing sensor histidine kinase [Kribbella voronezhensis]TDU88937.1 histidine kinase [Kribbella voronezhensis]